jgi:formate hydrogenlyase subunit 4
VLIALTLFGVAVIAVAAVALPVVTIQPMAIAGSLAALVGLASVARLLLRIGDSSLGTMSQPARPRVEAR